MGVALLQSVSLLILAYRRIVSVGASGRRGSTSNAYVHTREGIAS